MPEPIDRYEINKYIYKSSVAPPNLNSAGVKIMKTNMRAFALASVGLMLVLLTANAITFHTIQSGAVPLKPFNRWGKTLVDGVNESGHELSAYIDGVRYGIYKLTSAEYNTDIYVSGTDWYPYGGNFKSGGDDGDIITYMLKTTGGRTLIADETDLFIDGGQTLGVLNFTSSQGSEIHSLKIYQIYVNPAGESKRITLKNTGNTTITSNGNWRIKSNGGSPGDYENWFITVPAMGIAPEDIVEIDLSGKNISAVSGDIEICWKDNIGNIAGGKWIVMDRVEWSQTQSSHNIYPGNTTMPDKIGTIPVGYHLERKMGGKIDTDNCANDFAIVPDSTAAALDVKIDRPTAGEILYAGLQYDVNWTIYGSSIYTAYLNISSDGGATYSPLTVQTPSAGGYRWIISENITSGDTYVIRINVIDNSNISTRAENTSGVFSIKPLGNISYVSIFPDRPLVVYLDETVEFTAQAYTKDGSKITTGVTYSWSTSGGIGTVSPVSTGTAIFKAVNSGGGIGSVNITATLAGKTVSNNTYVEVSANKPVISRVDIVPAGPFIMNHGDEITLTAYAQTSDG